MDYDVVGLIALAAIIATVLRLEDWPPTDWTKEEAKNIVTTFVGSATAAVLFAWFYAETAGIFIGTYEGMMAITVSALGGMAGVRVAIDKIRGETVEEE